MRVLAVGLEEVDDTRKSPQRTAMNYYNPLGDQREQII